MVVIKFNMIVLVSTSFIFSLLTYSSTAQSSTCPVRPSRLHHLTFVNSLSLIIIQIWYFSAQETSIQVDVYCCVMCFQSRLLTISHHPTAFHFPGSIQGSSIRHLCCLGRCLILKILIFVIWSAMAGCY